MVLLDSEGNHMYAEIWKDSVPAFIDRIQEGHAYTISNFHVCDPKFNFRPVEARYMIKFTRYTTVQEQTDPNIEFPFCTYALTPLSHLTDPKDYPERFTGRRGVSGSAACRWYINDDIPDVLEFKKRLHDTFSPIERMVLPGQTVAEVKAQVELETKTVEELLAMNPYDHEESRFFVCVTLTRLSPSQRWWFTSCSACHKTTIPYGTSYKCLNSICKGTDAVPRYRICFLATDDQKEAEFVFFDRLGRDIVGKPLISLLRAGRSSHLSVNEVVHSARGESSIPRELATLVSKKFRFVVSYSSKSYLPETLESSFQVHRIDLPLGSNSRSSSMYRKPLTAGASSSGHVPLPAGSATSVSHGAVPLELLSPSSPSLLDSTSDPPADAGSAVVAAGKNSGKSPASVTKKPITRRKAKTDIAKPEICKPLFPGDDAKDDTAQAVMFRIYLLKRNQR
ncbi:unnamed protein product [Alopecurus aequalis]